MRAVVLLVLCHAWTVFAGQVILQWKAGASTSAAGYAVYVGDSAGNYQRRLDVGLATNASLSNLTSGVRYYIVVRAYNAAGIESDPSREVTCLIPGPVLLTGDRFNGFQIKFVGDTNKTSQIQTSTNLLNWTTIHLIRPGTNDWVSWPDTNSSVANWRFYRIVSAP